MEDIVPSGEVRLWVPGIGASDRRVRAVAKAVRDYDPDLRLARHELTGDWVVLIGDAPMPVYGFGKELPDPASVEATLFQRDVRRRGKRILDELAAKAERDRLDSEYRVSESNGELAEALESAFRRQGKHPVPRVFLPRGL